MCPFLIKGSEKKANFCDDSPERNDNCVQAGKNPLESDTFTSRIHISGFFFFSSHLKDGRAFSHTLPHSMRILELQFQHPCFEWVFGVDFL